jgi:hypothetical protein
MVNLLLGGVKHSRQELGACRMIDFQRGDVASGATLEARVWTPLPLGASRYPSHGQAQIKIQNQDERKNGRWH